MRFHALGIPHTITSKKDLSCAFTQKVLKFCKMMTDLGHEVIHYGHEHSEVQCTEHVTVLEDKWYKMAYGEREENQTYTFSNDDMPYIIFYENACREIEARKQPGDFLLAFWGAGHRKIADVHHDMLVVEPGIGYPWEHFARYKVFESYAIMHAYYGLDGVAYCKTTPENVVIPNYFDADDFEVNLKKEDYFLYLGRCIPQKGIDIMVEATKDAGVGLMLAGPMSEESRTEFPPHCRYFGFANASDRKRLLANAKALIIATQYVEPFVASKWKLYSAAPQRSHLTTERL